MSHGSNDDSRDDETSAEQVLVARPGTAAPPKPAERAFVPPPANPKGNPMGRFGPDGELPIARVRRGVADPRRRLLMILGLLVLVVVVAIVVWRLVLR